MSVKLHVAGMRKSVELHFEGYVKIYNNVDQTL